MMDEQLGELIGFGAEAGEGTIVPAHAAVGAILPAEIGDLDHRADENAASEVADGGVGRKLVQVFLCVAASAQMSGGGGKWTVNHAFSKGQGTRSGQCKFRQQWLGKHPIEGTLRRVSSEE